MMLTYTHNHAPEILLWRCSCLQHDASLTSVITMELKLFFSLRCWFLCMTSLAVTSSMLKTSVKFWGPSFKFWLRPCIWYWKYYKTSIKYNMKNKYFAIPNKYTIKVTRWRGRCVQKTPSLTSLILLYVLFFSFTLCTWWRFRKRQRLWEC